MQSLRLVQKFGEGGLLLDIVGQEEQVRVLVGRLVRLRLKCITATPTQAAAWRFAQRSSRSPGGTSQSASCEAFQTSTISTSLVADGAVSNHSVGGLGIQRFRPGVGM
jgi:hypothetical protein